MAGAQGDSAAATRPRGQIGHYRIVKQVGEGGMGVVYLALDQTLGRNVALKLLAPALSANEEFRSRFVRESRLAAAIEHTNIIPVYEAGAADGQLFIAMRYVAGLDLRRMLASQGPLDPMHAAEIVEQVACALDAAHREGLVHRDVKPANVMISQSEGRDHCYLTDFGLTKRAAASSGFTQSGRFVGTLNYMAPEQIEGRPVDGRADTYALGCMLFECLTGDVPFPRDSEVAMMYAHLHEPPPSPCAIRPDLPEGVDEVLRRAMAKAPGDRHSTCQDVLAELRAALGGAPIPPFEPSSASTGPRFGRATVPGPPPPDPWENTTNRSAGETSSAAPPTSGSPTHAAPTPKTSPSAKPARRRRVPRLALLAGLLVLLCGAGAVAALSLTHHDDPSAVSQQEAQQRLLDRAVRLQRDLGGVATQVKHAHGKKPSSNTQHQLEAAQTEARSLIAEARALQAGNEGFKQTIETLGKQLGDSTDALTKYAKTGSPLYIHIYDRKSVVIREHFRQVAEEAPTLDVPLKPASVVSAAGAPTQRVRLPGDAAMSIDPGAGRTVTSVSGLGDVNGDQVDDLGVVTAPSDGSDGQNAYVLFSGTGEDESLDDLTADRGFEIPGATSVARLGDVGGDSNDDVAVTGAEGDPQFVVFGQDKLSTIDLATLGGDGLEISLPTTGPTVIASAGDVNGDDVEDLIVGDPQAEGGDGSAWVVFGDEQASGPIDLSTLDPAKAIRIDGDPGAALGTSVAGAGDLDNNGVPDVIVGAPDHVNGDGDATGAAYVIYGSDQIQDVDVSSLTSDAGVAIVGAEPGAKAGTVVAGLGDAGGDTASDVLVTAPGSGAASVVFGGDAPEDVTLGEPGTQQFTLGGAVPGDATGGLGATAAPAGDLDGDGSGDFVLGAPGSGGAIAYIAFGGGGGGGGGGSDPIDLRDPGDRAVEIGGTAGGASDPVPVGATGEAGDTHGDVVVGGERGYVVHVKR